MIEFVTCQTSINTTGKILRHDFSKYPERIESFLINKTLGQSKLLWLVKAFIQAIVKILAVQDFHGTH